MLCFERVRLGIESSISLILAKVGPIASWLKLQVSTARKLEKDAADFSPRQSA